MITDLKNRVALVTGAGSGIGKAMALAFAQEGMKPAIVDVNPESLEKTYQEIEAIGADVMSRIVDVSDREEMKRLAADTFERFGTVNLLCNNAGVGTGGLLSEIYLENWDWIMGVNLYGVIHGIHFFLKQMMESGEECHIVNTASIAGLIANGDQALYSVTKFGVVALSESLRQQLERQQSRVGVSVLCPGFINTNILTNSEALAGQQEGLYQPPEALAKMYKPMMENFHRRIKSGMDPGIVAKMVIDSVKNDRQYILTEPIFPQMMALRSRAIMKDVRDLQEAMQAQGIGTEKTDLKTYTHPAPEFSISYPGNWVVQDSTAFMSFDFMAVSETWFPNVIVRVDDAPENGLKNAIADSAQFIVMSLGLETRVVSEKPSSLQDGTDAVEGEVEIQMADGANQIISFILAVQKGDKTIRVSLGMFEFMYDETVKAEFRETAYSLTFK